MCLLFMGGVFGQRGKRKHMRFPDEHLVTDGKAGVTKEEPSIARMAGYDIE